MTLITQSFEQIGIFAVVLQWGHATMGVENHESCPAAGAARRSFNGATPRWAWKTHGPGAARLRTGKLQWGHATMGVENIVYAGDRVTWYDASMGPRHDGRGKPQPRRYPGGARAALQWGHATMGVEN